MNELDGSLVLLLLTGALYTAIELHCGYRVSLRGNFP